MYRNTRAADDMPTANKIAKTRPTNREKPKITMDFLPIPSVGSEATIVQIGAHGVENRTARNLRRKQF